MKFFNKKIAAFILLLSIIAIVFSGCSQESINKDVSDQSGKSQTFGSYDIEELKIIYAKNFDIDYMENGVKIVTDSEGRKLLLVPKDKEVSEGYEDTVLIRTPIDNVICTSTPMIGFLGIFKKEELYDSITAVTTSKENWTTPEILERLENGKITYIEQNHTQAANIEEIAKLKPEIVFSSGGDQAGLDLRAQLDEMGINYIVTLDHNESSDQAYLEWIKLYGAFYNLDKEATEIFNELIKKMDDLKQKAINKPQEEKPVVAVGMIWNGVVYSKGAESAIAKNIEAAGGVYALNNLPGEGSVQIGMEEFFNRCKDADILIYNTLEQYAPDKKYLMEIEPLIAEFRAFKEGSVYVFKKGYYMNALAVDEKFEDLVFMINPDLMPDGYRLKHHVKVPDAREE